MISGSKRPGEASSVRSSQAVAEVAGGRVVPKPMPQSHVDDARAYQIEQLRRRFSPKESPVANGGTLLAFPISPSDPDFPFELDKLHCELTVPARYPAQSPKLQVKNADVPRGFAINIEKGWDKLVTERPAATLLALVHALDRSLEAFLSEQKAETVKLTLFKDNRHLDAQRSVKKQVDEAKKPHIPEESFSKEQIAEAKAKRSQEVRQLEARMSRLPLYQQSCDGIVYTLPLEPRRRAQLPAGLQAVKSVQLIIPYLYPLQSIRFLLNDVESKDAEAVEALFTKKSKEQAQMTLMSRLNYLVQNLHVLAQQVQKEAAEEAATSAAYRPTTSSAVEAKEGSDSADGERSHVHVIPRPPEWTLADGSGESGASEDEDDDEEDIDEDDGGGAPLNPPDTVRDRPSGLSQVPEKGTALTFPSVELHGIELLQVAVLGLRLKCSRCKTMNEMGGLRAGVEKQASCRKCATTFSVIFRPELVHQNSTRAGFIDTAACTLADLLPRYACQDSLPLRDTREYLCSRPRANGAQHLRAHLRPVLDAVSRTRIRARRNYDQRLPRVPQPLHLQDSRREVSRLHARVRRPPARYGPAAPAREAGPPRGRGAPRAWRLRALPSQLPLVPLRVLQQGLSVRPVPRRGRRRRPRPRVGQSHDLRLVFTRAKLPRRELRLLRPQCHWPARQRVLGGRKRHAEPRADEARGQEEASAHWRRGSGKLQGGLT